jgi:hypothetical protein
LRARHLFFVLIAAATICGPAWAQLALPGATAPAPVGTVVAPNAPHKPRVRGPATAPAAPLASNLGGKTLHLNGGASEMAFVAQDKTVGLSLLMLAGSKISNSHDECQVNVAGMPLPLTPLGKVGGLLRFSIPVPACAITFDVLDGAVLTGADTAVCIFKEADCSVNPAGLWGPAPGEIGPDQVKTIERERTEADRKVRAAYQGLVGSTKDRAAIRGFASEQAGFSSRREELCRDYIGESRHGYCASRLTAARAAALATQLSEADAQKELRKARSAR